MNDFKDYSFSDFLRYYPQLAIALGDKFPLLVFLADGRYRVKVFSDKVSIYLPK